MRPPDDVLLRALDDALRRAPDVLLRAPDVLLRALAVLLRALCDVLLRALCDVLLRAAGEPAFGRDACCARAGVPRRMARANDLIRSGFRRFEVPVTPRLRSWSRSSSTRRWARSFSRMLLPARRIVAVAGREPPELLRAARAPEPVLRAVPRDPLDVALRRRLLVC
ncbi:hypothetical protein O7608_00215 [Solwaraspora sp. WMMA2056]|uniref:hypothetical protein n=1 Tax=Solwaraspora sp. WMMA2056 TaxID=3015161 RepID=UPI00259B4888|nr:hypothetical protein [Solwaraspora sp. WMMA2056]WJK40931.1 hypothetical protein O7608_00215 [Solwaraspora sp. WMMA2056]